MQINYIIYYILDFIKKKINDFHVEKLKSLIIKFLDLYIGI